MDEVGQLVDALGCEAVHLVEQHDVGQGQLLVDFGLLVHHVVDVLGVGQADDAVDGEGLLQAFGAHERAHHAVGVGDAGGLDQQVVELPSALEEPRQRLVEIVGERAADAAVRQFEDAAAVGLDYQVGVDAYLAELVFDYREPLAGVFCYDVVEKRRLACSEESRDDCHMNLFLLHLVDFELIFSE